MASGCTTDSAGFWPILAISRVLLSLVKRLVLMRISAISPWLGLAAA